MKNKICLIVASSSNRVIGNKNDLPWRGLIPQDLKRFKEITLGHPVIMGRNTWDSIPSKFRPLPGRVNIVLTRNKNFTAKEALIALTLEEAIKLAKQSAIKDRVFIIGGEGVYKTALQNECVDLIYLTLIHKEFTGDTFLPQNFPINGGGSWKQLEKEDLSTKDGLSFSFITLEKR